MPSYALRRSPLEPHVLARMRLLPQSRPTRTAHAYNTHRWAFDSHPPGQNGLGGKSIYDFGSSPIQGSAAQFNSNFGAMMVDANATTMRVRFVDAKGGVKDDALYSASAWPTNSSLEETLVPAFVGGIVALVVCVGVSVWCRGKRARRPAVQKSEAHVTPAPRII